MIRATFLSEKPVNGRVDPTSVIMVLAYSEPMSMALKQASDYVSTYERTIPMEGAASPARITAILLVEP